MEQLPVEEGANDSMSEGLELQSVEEGAGDNDGALANILNLYEQVQILMDQKKE